MKKGILLGLVAITVLSIGIASQGHATEARPGITPRVIIGTDDRTSVTGAQLEQAPYRWTVFLDVTFEDGSVAYGSGAMIAKDTVLTCGHVLFDSNAGWATEVKVHAGYDGVNNKYFAKSSEVLGFSSWTQGANMDDKPDVAAIKLDRNLGDQTGWFPIQKNTLLQDKITLTGFPGEKDRTMWTDNGVITKKYNHGIGYNADSTGGNSGSPVYNQNNELVAIHSGALLSSSLGTHNTGTVFTDEVKQAVDFWVTGQSAVEVTGVSVSEQRVTLQKDETRQLNATITPSNASYKEGKWKSSDTSIASVDHRGKVTGKNNGQATITFTSDDNKIQATCVVNVVDDNYVPLERIDFRYSDEIEYVEKRGIFSRYSPTFIPANASNKEVYYTSSNLEILDLDLKDPYHPRYLKSGEVDVYCHSKDNGQAYKVATYHVDDHGETLETATPIESGISQFGFFYRTYDVDYFKFVPTKSGEYTIDGEVIGQYSHELNQAWEFTIRDENNNKLYSTQNRKMSYAFEAGKTYYIRPNLRRFFHLDEDIYRTNYAFDIYPKGTEKPNPITGIELDKTSVEIDEGKKEMLFATISPSTTPDDKTIQWSSSDDAIATVNNGEITGVKEGQATITATTSNGKTAACEVTVNKVIVPVERIQLYMYTQDVGLGYGSETIEALVYPENATNKELNWQIEDTSVAEFTSFTAVNRRSVQALKLGITKVTATSGAVSSEIVVNCVAIDQPVTIERTLQPNEVYEEVVQLPDDGGKDNRILINGYVGQRTFLSVVDDKQTTPHYNQTFSHSGGFGNATQTRAGAKLTIRFQNPSATHDAYIKMTLKTYPFNWQPHPNFVPQIPN